MLKLKFKANPLGPGLSALILLLCLGTVFYPCPARSGDAMHFAAYHGRADKVREYIDRGVDVDERDSYGATALHAAMFQNNIRIIRMLIDAGYDVNAQGTENGFTPLHDAVWANNLQGAKLLIASGARLDIRDKKGQTPYDKAVAEGRTGMLEVLKGN
ncbi:ankyrin repeat domain-containing protein [Maridesulfovibrio sp. FT414]|uniref:ankyrin repeat domain-containing protein n=1 Tax=Maridesulfovibrio sp. FT414 TaxID=2979469 RepID=UPI003D803AF2